MTSEVHTEEPVGVCRGTGGVTKDVARKKWMWGHTGRAPGPQFSTRIPCRDNRCCRERASGPYPLYTLHALVQ